MEEYTVTKIEYNEYTAIFTMYASESPLGYISGIEKMCKEYNYVGKILIDQLLHSGNNDERFIEVEVTIYGIDGKSINFVKIPRKSLPREISCKLLMESGILNFSILPITQVRLINKGIAI
ncbi:MAG: type II toxin-antitoxin system RnlB family antitoxin [Clostridiales bacterium]|nr:type II toxin-antitoxin system RnlB family antitoxin [Clostridiales bacterium]